MRPDVPPHGAQSAPWGPRRSGATSEERGPHRASCARWGAIPGVFERGATQPAPGPPTRQPRWGGGGMQRRPNAAELSPRAVKPCVSLVEGTGKPDVSIAILGTRRRSHLLLLAALGVVFGDIGTSPLYALRECFDG